MDVVGGLQVGGIAAAAHELVAGEAERVAFGNFAAGAVRRTVGGQLVRDDINSLVFGAGCAAPVPTGVKVGCRAGFLRAETDVAADDVCRQGLDAGRSLAFDWFDIFVDFAHPALPDGQGHTFHTAAHGHLALVVTNPDTSGVLGGVAHHPTVFGVVSGTGLDRELPLTLVAVKALWLDREVAGPRVAEDIADNVGAVRSDGLLASVWLPFHNGFIVGVGNFEDVGLGDIEAVARQRSEAVDVFVKFKEGTVADGRGRVAGRVPGQGDVAWNVTAIALGVGVVFVRPRVHQGFGGLDGFVDAGGQHGLDGRDVT